MNYLFKVAVILVFEFFAYACSVGTIEIVLRIGSKIGLSSTTSDNIEAIEISVFLVYFVALFIAVMVLKDEYDRLNS